MSSRRGDVTDYTRVFAKSHRGDFRGFQADLARLAEEHGISNMAIGEGLGSANGIMSAALDGQRTAAALADAT